MATVTVIINVYNGEAYLKECLESVLHQHRKPDQILCIDNNSTDGTRAIIEAFNSPLITVKTPPHHMRLYEARNYALSFITSDYSAFIDADDVWTLDKLEKQMALVSDDTKLVHGLLTFIDENSETLHDHPPFPTPYKGASLTARLLEKNFISISGALIETTLLQTEKFDSFYNILGDFDLWVRLSCKTQFDHVPSVVELSRAHAHNLSKTLTKDWTKERQYFYRKFIRQHGLSFPILKYIFKTTGSYFKQILTRS